jgi:hypothetical protein
MSDVASCIAGLKRFLDLSLTAETIAEKLEPYPTTLAAHDLRKKLEELGYDVAVIQEPDSKRVYRYVRIESLSDGACGDCAEDIPLEGTVARATSLSDCLESIVDQGRVFVIGRRGVEEIITRADLDKQPMRLLLFGVVSTLEMAMLALLKRRFPEGSWHQHLTPERMAKAQKILEARQQRNEDLDLADCLQICDKVTVFLKDNEVLESWGFGSKGEAERFFERLQKLRDKLAHAHNPASGSSWEGVVSTFRKAEEMLSTSIGLLRSQEIARFEPMRTEG